MIGNVSTGPRVSPALIFGKILNSLVYIQVSLTAVTYIRLLKVMKSFLIGQLNILVIHRSATEMGVIIFDENGL